MGISTPRNDYILLVDGILVTEYMQHMHTWEVL